MVGCQAEARVCDIESAVAAENAVKLNNLRIENKLRNSNFSRVNIVASNWSLDSKTWTAR